MYTLRDDINIYSTRHQDLLEQSQQYTEQTIPLKTRLTRVYKFFLALAGSKMIAWGYRMYKKSGIAVEISISTPPYAIEKGC